jgi:hypothetical protein
LWAAVLVAGLGLGGAGPLRAADEPPTPARQDEENRKLFRDERELVPPLRADLLDHVTDSAGLPVLPGKPPPTADKAKERAYLILLDEWEAYCDAVIKASRTPARTFAEHARPELTYAHLFNEPRKYRGQVVHFEGQLHRVRRYDPPQMLAQAGVQDLYEGWIFSKLYGLNPVCVVFTELPPGVKVAEQMNVPASFDGYFFKKYRYQAADSKPGTAREVPLVIGHGPVVHEAAAGGPATAVWSGTLLAILVVLVVGTLVLAVGLHWWFRHNDAQVRRRLAAFREPVPPPEAGGPEVRLPSPWPGDPSAS